MTGKKKRLVVIDGKSVFYRGYYAMPNLSTPEGIPTGGVYGFGMMALDIVKKMHPDYVCVAWDKPKTNIRRRRKIYPEYKANRKPAPPDFYVQIPLLKQMLKAFGWPLYEIDDHEADDILGTFAKQASEKGIETVLVTSDRDALQLISDNITVAILKKGLTNVETFDVAHLSETLGMTTDEFVDYKALRGDPSDNIPGVAGVGEKTAKQLIEDYGSLDGVYDHLNDIKPALRTKLQKDKDMAYLTKKLVTLDCNVPLHLDFRQADMRNLDPAAIRKVFKKFDFKTLLRQLPESMREEKGQGDSEDADLGSKMSVDFVRTGTDLSKLSLEVDKHIVLHAIFNDLQGRDIRALIVSTSSRYAIVFEVSDKLTLSQITDKIRIYLEADNIKLIGYDTKKLIKSFLFVGVKAGPVAHDIKIAAFLLNSLSREQTLDALVRKKLGFSGADLDSVAPDELLLKAPKIVDAIWRVYKEQINKFESMPKLTKLANEIEWPIISVLASMERVGIKLDVTYLKKTANELGETLSDLEQSIYGFAEKEFNISSPKQLADILFGTLKLPTNGIKKTKTGYSTAARELNKLSDQHPIIKYIFSYRELSKLKSTYADTLPKQVDEASRVHTTFNLTATATGRLSSNNPNLQNIPVRSEMGRKIRRAFISDKGRKFISADYSQAELRVAAVLADDKGMIKAFNDDVDIHTQTAAQMYGIDENSVTKAQRRSAKAVNFGVMYGQGAHGLSEGTGMNFQEAKDFINRYFEIRPALKKYLLSIEEKAKIDGYVETLYGRRRPTPDINSSNYMVREAAKRAAINMPIQGTAADIMKRAMIDIDKKLDDNCSILLQIHDSVLVECSEDSAEKTATMITDVMESTVDLAVKFKVDTKIADNWGNL